METATMKKKEIPMEMMKRKKKKSTNSNCITKQTRSIDLMNDSNHLKHE